MALPVRGSRLGFSLLLLFVLLLGAAPFAQAGTVFCSDFTQVGPNAYVVDGLNPTDAALIDSASTFGIDANCTIKNFPLSSGGFPITNINYQFWGNETYYINFDNVYYTGNMSCNDPTQANFWIYWAPGGYNNISPKCQEFMVPVDAVIKQNPTAQTTASIGVPFVYTIKVPVLGILDSTGTFGYLNNSDDYPINNVVIVDDLTTSGVALSYVSNTAYSVDPDTGTRTALNGGAPLTLGASGTWLSNHPGVVSDSTKHLVFSYENNPALDSIPAGNNIEIDLTVVLDPDTSVNTPGTWFTNTAEMWFDKTINSTDMVDLHAWPGTTLDMTIAEPNLQVEKTSTETNINVGTVAPFEIDVHNNGGSTAWNAEITDIIPTGPDGPGVGGMCAYDPTSAPGGVTAKIVAADYTLVSNLDPGSDYSVTYSGCKLTLTLGDTPVAKIEPNQHLIINYQTQLDAGTNPGLAFTNVAGATRWFNGERGNDTRLEYDKTLTNGTPGTPDFQDAYTINSATQGYFFLKSVEDLTTGTSSATTAFPGDRMRYTLQIQNFDIPPLNNIMITDDLGASNTSAVFLPGISIVNSTLPAAATVTTCDSCGTNGAPSITITGLGLGSNEQYQLQFDVALASPLTDGTHVSNQASLAGTDSANKVWSGVSDNPDVGGPALLSASGDVTTVTIQAPGGLSKANSQGSATIGEQFKYRITVPATPTAAPLYDVRILDGLGASAAGLRFVEANVISPGARDLSNTGSATDLVIEDTATGIDIPANGQVVIEITVALENITTNQSNLSFQNSASYTYNRINGNDATQTAGGAGSTTGMTVVEPDLTAAKVASNAMPGKAAGDPITGGDIIQYVLTITNGGNSTAYDVNVVDTLPSALTFYGSFVPTATIDSSPVSGFVATPDGASGGPLVWGRGNGDESLDIPAGGSMVLTYRAQVLESTATTFSNLAWIDWTSLDDVSAFERTGEGCPTTTAPDDYCYGPASVTTTTTDNNSLTKAIVADTYVDAPSTAGDKVVRIGDTATYRLTLNLGEGTTRNVKVQDVLPAGMAYDSLVSILPASGSGTFTYSVVSQPAAGATGTLTWDLGNVDNSPSNDGTPVDALVIEYKAKVLPDAGIAQVPTTSLTNTATLSYLDAGGNAVVDPTRLVGSDTLTLWQPMLTVNKSATPAGGDNIIEAGEAVTYTVDIVNSGAAPAYDTVLVDTLPSGMRQGGVTMTSVVMVTAGTTLPVLAPAYDANTGVATWNFDSGTANAYTIPAGETLRVVYQVTADADLGAGLILTNTATATLYTSFDDEAIPANGSVNDRQVYGPTNTATTNLTTPTPGAPLKQNPANTTATIGQEFTYTITVPATPQPTALHDVRILDNLGAVSANLSLVSISKVSGSQTWTPVNTGTGTALVIEDTSNGIEIPVNEQIVVGVTMRMNNVVSNADGLSFSNAASYTYNKIDGDVTTQTSGGSSATAEMMVLESNLTATKVVSNATPGKAAGDPITGGDIIQYVVTLNNGGNATAYDVNVVDTLPSALTFYSSFVPTATVDSSPVSGFVATPAGTPGGPLVWGRGNGDDSLDIPAGGSLVLTYRAQVLESTATTFSNLAWVDWTSLDDASGFERTGAGCPSTTAPNDYCYGPASVTTTTTDNNSLAKAIVADTYVDAPSTAGDKIVRIGDTATYRLTLNLGEGTTRSVKVQDVLPAGMAYDSLVSILPASGSGTFTYSVVSQPAAGATGTLTWDLGNVDNSPSNDGTPVDALVIEYKAKVLPDAGIAQVPTTSLTNTATLSYLDAGGNAVVDPTRLVGSDTLTLWQPMLTVNKSATPAGGDNIIEAGEAVTYTVDIVNSGAAPAYDTVLVDTLPSGMRQGGVTMTSVVMVTAGTTLPVLAPAYDANTGVATWNFDSGTANAYTIPAGETLRVVYQVTADADLGASLTLTNAATATLYTSFDDEAIPAGGSVNDRQVYGPTNTATTNLTTPTPGALLKENTQPTAAIGEQFKYRITLPATPVNTALHDVRILDDLSASAADLRFVSVAKVSGSGSWTPVNSGSDTNLVIMDTAGGIDIPAGEQVVVEVTVELLNTPTNVVGLSFTNTADYTYNQVANTPASQTNGLPGTTEAMQIVGLIAQKTVSMAVDNNSNGLVDPGDVLLYTLTVHNPGTAPATGVVLTDDVPANTIYVADSVTLNGLPVGTPDGGIPPLASGVAINSAGSISGTIAARSSAVVTFKVQIIAGVPAGTVISNQGYVTSNELPTEPTDADGNAANGYQPTTIVVGSDQQVMITKEVFVVGGGAALPGSELEYVMRVTNTGTTPTTNLVITDDLTSLTGKATYVVGSATLNGTTAGVSYAAPVLTGNYATTYGNLLPGATATLRFRVLIDSGLAIGTRLTNTAQMAWNTPTLTAPASASVDIGGVIGSAMLSGQVWHDANLDKLYGTGETNLDEWTVGLYRNNVQVASVTTDADGLYSFSGLEPTLTTAGQYELRFTAPGAGPNTAMLGYAHSPFINGPQRISGIIVASGANLQNLNLPISPNGVVYNSVLRNSVAGARLALLNAATNAPLPSQCFDDPSQQNQVTALDGFYKFDLNFSDPSCQSGASYLIEVTPPATGYVSMPSQIIPPNGEPTAPFSVPACSGSADNGDALPTTAEYCEVTASASVPSDPPRTGGTIYHLYLTLSNGPVPVQNQAFNNHIPVDPDLEGAVFISKISSLINVTKGQLVPYTIKVRNTIGKPLYDISIVDRFPAGFKYVEGSARLDGNPREPRINGRELGWDGLELQFDEERKLQLLLVVGAGVSEGEYVNRAQAINTATGRNVSGEASATVRVIPDPTFDCTDVIGKVFDDCNLDGQQDPGEKGLPGVRVATARGLLATTDEHGRFHITCAVVPDEDRGSNFILKLDDRSLPTGYRVTTENPRVQRATRGKMLRFNFGATIHRVVAIDIADGVFEPDTTELRLQWTSKIGQLLEELKKSPAVLRLSYLADIEREGLVKERLKALKKEIASQWDRSDGGYRLTIETEVFWRRGGPPG